jgi:hypothetical protein
MKALFLLLFPFTLLSQTKVSIQILQVQHYCGGIKPPKETLDELAKPKPYANKQFVFVSSKGKTCKATTDANGYLKIKLKAGSYKGYEAWRFNKKTPDGTLEKNFDTECLKKAWEKVDITIDAQKSTQNVKIDIDEAYCPHTIPCILNPKYPE